MLAKGPERSLDAARRVLRDLNDERALRRNPLFAGAQELDHDALRTRVLRAIEALDPGIPSHDARARSYRHHQILTRCDLQGQSHQTVAAALGLSRRQFYRDRRDAFLAFVDVLRVTPAAPRFEVVLEDAMDMHLAYVQSLREQGRFDAVWRESMHVLRDLRDDAREVEIWCVAAEAARYFGNVRQSQQAIERMRQAAEARRFPHLGRASAMRVAISEMTLDWMMGDPAAALGRFDRVVATCGDERTMYGRDATLFAILCSYGAMLAMESGQWERAAECARRSERIIDRSELPHARAAQQQLRGTLALRRDGDVARSVVELREGLAAAQTHKTFALVAKGAVEFGLALCQGGSARGSQYVEYGLAIGREVCGYDEFAILVAAAAPELARGGAVAEALRSIDEVRTRSPLGTRADVFGHLSEAVVYFDSGKIDLAMSACDGLGDVLERMNLFPAAAKARLIMAEAVGALGRISQAKRLLVKARELIDVYGERATKVRARQMLRPLG